MFDFEYRGPLQHDNHPVTALTFQRNPSSSMRLAVADTQRKVSVLDLNGASPTAAHTIAHTIDSGHSIYDLCWVPQSGKWQDVASAGPDGVRLYRLSAVGGEPEPISLAEDGRYQRIAALRREEGGARIVAADGESTIHIWDIETDGTMAAQRTLPKKHVGRVHAIRVFSSHQLVAVADDDRITIWNLKDISKPERHFGGGDNRTLLSAYDALSEPLMISACGHGVQMWDVRNGRLITTFARDHQVRALAGLRTPDGELLVAVASGEGISLWNPYTQTGHQLRAHDARLRNVEAMARVFDGGTLYLAAADGGTVHLWRQAPRQRTARECHHRGWVNDLVAVKDGDEPSVFTASDDGTVRQWFLLRNRQLELEPPAGLATAPQVQALAAIGSDLAIGLEDGGIEIWHDADPKNRRRVESSSAIRAMAVMDGERQQGSRLTAPILLSAGGGGTVSVWDSRSLTTIRVLATEGNHALVRSLAVLQYAEPGDQGEDRSRSLVAAADDGGTIRVWDVHSGDFVWFWEPAQQPQIRRLAAITVGGHAYLVAGCDDGFIRVWNFPQTMHGDGPGTAHPIVIINAHNGPVSALTPIETSADDGGAVILASGGGDGFIRLWDTGLWTSTRPADDPAMARLICQRRAHSHWVRTLTQVKRPSGPTEIVSGGDDNEARVWTLRDDQLVSNSYANAIRGFGDRPANTDLMDRRALVNALVHTLEPQPLDEAVTDPSVKPTDGPQVVTIQGGWGAGKTSVMRFVADAFTIERPSGRKSERQLSPWSAWVELHKRPVVMADGEGSADRGGNAPSAAPRVITAWFNPWAYQSSEQVWSGLANTIIQAARPGFESTADRQRFWLRRNLDRLDRSRLLRSFHLAVWRPALIAIALGLIPILAGLLSNSEIKDFSQVLSAPLMMIAIVVACIVGGVIALCAIRIFAGSASSYLPTDVLEGSVVPQSPVADLAMVPLSRIDAHSAASGPLFHSRRDVLDLATHLARRGRRIIVFIDDLDRCSASTITQVFEGIAAFMDRSDDRSHFPGSVKFVMGIDPDRIVARLDQAGKPGGDRDRFPGAAVDPSRVEDDPSPTWAVLRKISQLAVILPPTRFSHADRLLHHHAPTETPTDDDRRSTPSRGSIAASQSEKVPAPPRRSRTEWLGRRGTIVRAFGTDEPLRATVAIETGGELPRYLEADPTVRAHLRRLVNLRPRQSMRETKRLMTLWTFYLRLIATTAAHRRELSGDRLALDNEQVTITPERACNVMTLAEILSRWPALVSTLTRVHPAPVGQLGLTAVVRAANFTPDTTTHPKVDARQITWNKTIHSLGLGGEQLQPLTDGLLRLLREFTSQKDLTLLELAEDLICEEAPDA